jgi:hypothetical protein
VNPNDEDDEEETDTVGVGGGKERFAEGGFLVPMLLLQLVLLLFVQVCLLTLVLEEMIDDRRTGKGA